MVLRSVRLVSASQTTWENSTLIFVAYSNFGVGRLLSNRKLNAIARSRTDRQSADFFDILRAWSRKTSRTVELPPNLDQRNTSG